MGNALILPDEHQYLDSNRVINPAPLVPDRPLEWQVEENTEVCDGAGVRMGVVAPRLKMADGKRVPSAKFSLGSEQA